MNEVLLFRDTVVPELDMDAEDSDADSDSMDQTKERNILTENSISCLNSPEFVAGIVQIAERSEKTGSNTLATFSGSRAIVRSECSENIRNICKICHQLLIYNTQVDNTRFHGRTNICPKF